MFSADLVTHHLRNPLLKNILVYLDRDIEILLHCTLQTPALACSLGYFGNPALFKNPPGNPFHKDICLPRRDIEILLHRTPCKNPLLEVQEEGGREERCERRSSFDYLQTSLAQDLGHFDSLVPFRNPLLKDRFDYLDGLFGILRHILNFLGTPLLYSSCETSVTASTSSGS